MAFELVTAPESVVKIKVIGVGGGGNNVVNRMVRAGVTGVDFVAVNTDKQALNISSAEYKIQIGEKLTHGQGAGSDPEVGRKSAEESRSQIAKALEETDMVFITAGMGGGTGTGAGPVVARVAKERGLLTIGIVTIPFIFEGKKKILKALDGADEMSKYVDALLIINNERLAEIYADFDFFNAFGKADDTLSTAASSISEIITREGYINLDFEDVDTTLRDGGTAIISTGYGEGEHRVTKAIEDALNSPLLKNRDIFGSKKLLINLYMPHDGDNTVYMNEVNELRSFTSSIDSDVDVIFGVTKDNSLGEKVKITILAAGFDVTIRDEEEEEMAKGGRPFFPGPRTQPQPNNNAQNDRLTKEYGTSIGELGTNYIILTPDQMDDDAVMEVLEKSPAYNREKRVVDDLKKGVPNAPQQPAGGSGSTSGNVISF